LLRVSKAPKKSLQLFVEGVSLEATFGVSIEDLTHRVTADRLHLGEHFLSVANRMRRSRSQDWRSVIGRYYYSMYHGMRAVCFYSFGGDDNEQHTKISSFIPEDFPQRDLRANELKDARLRRNEADYDPYPTDATQFRAPALALQLTANNFVGECRRYLTAKGVGHL
jgi:uncharacterized protein (UPF0332 family)